MEIRISRRMFCQRTATLLKGAICLTPIATALSCSNSQVSSPTQPQVSNQPPPPPQTPGAVFISAPPGYVLAIQANAAFGNIFGAFQAAGCSYKTKNDAGHFVTSINGIDSGSWKIDVAGKPFCTESGLASVPSGSIIGCYMEDGRKVAGSCLS